MKRSHKVSNTTVQIDRKTAIKTEEKKKSSFPMLSRSHCLMCSCVWMLSILLACNVIIVIPVYIWMEGNEATTNWFEFVCRVFVFVELHPLLFILFGQCKSISVELVEILDLRRSREWYATRLWPNNQYHNLFAAQFISKSDYCQKGEMLEKYSNRYENSNQKSLDLLVSLTSLHWSLQRAQIIRCAESGCKLNRWCVFFSSFF